MAWEVGGSHRWGIPRGLWLSYLIESKRDLHPFLPSGSHGFSSLSPSSPLSHAAHLSILEWARRKWASLAVSSTDGEARYLLTCSHVPLGEIADIAGLLALSYAGLRGGVSRKSESVPLILLNVSSLKFVFQQCVGNSCYTPGHAQRHFWEWLSNSPFFGVKTVGKLLFPSFCCHYSQILMFGNTNCHKYLSLLEENNFNFSVIDNYEFCVVLLNTD